MMGACEKCWGQAYTRSRGTGKSQADCYYDILQEKERDGKICTPQEQAGDYWDKEKQCDSRFVKENAPKGAPEEATNGT